MHPMQPPTDEAVSVAGAAGPSSRRSSWTPVVAVLAALLVAACGGSDGAGSIPGAEERDGDDERETAVEVEPSWQLEGSWCSADCDVAADADRAYVVDAGEVTAHDLVTGDEVWRTPIQPEQLHDGGIFVVDDTVLVESGLPGEGETALTALAAETGTVVWRSADPGGPRLWRDGAGSAVASGSVVLIEPSVVEPGPGLPVRGVDLATGETVWETNGDIIDACEGVVYTVARPVDTGPNIAPDSIAAVDVGSGDKRYEVNDIGSVLTPGSGCGDGHLVVGVAGEAGSTVTIDPSGSARSWTLDRPRPLVLGAGAVVYVEDEEGLSRLDPESDELVWSIEIPSDGNFDVDVASDQLASYEGQLFDPRSGDTFGEPDDSSEILATDGDTAVVHRGGRFVGVLVTDDHELVEQYTLDVGGAYRRAAAGDGVVVVVSSDRLVGFEP